MSQIQKGMNKKMRVLKRALSSLVSGLLIFVILCLIYRIVYIEEKQWLLNSALWAFGWTIGDFSANSFAQLRLRATKLIFLNLLVAILVTITLIFLIGYVLQVATWQFVVYQLVFSFIFALFSRAKWKR